MDGWNTIVSFWDGLFSGANCLASGRVLETSAFCHWENFWAIFSLNFCICYDAVETFGNMNVEQEMLVSGLGISFSTEP